MVASRPNIVFVMADDHAAHAIGCYGSRINQTPWIDRLASEGMRFTNCFCTNSLCSPSRAAILTGTYNHVNGVLTLSTLFDARQPAFPGLLQAAGYQTALVGKWHLGHGGIHDPRGFDHWWVFPDQGAYHDPEMLELGQPRRLRGYATDLVTNLAIGWMEARDPSRPFCVLVHHKAPHRPWLPDDGHAGLYQADRIPEPPTFADDYRHRSAAAAQARMRVADDLGVEDLKAVVPPGLAGDQRAAWAYQRYIKDYLRCVASLDDNLGRLLGYLDDAGLAGDTVVVYTSDQGFFLGDHGWYDKRFMYEESLRMPLLVRYPPEVPEGSLSQAMVLNVDFAQTLLDLAGVPTHPRMQGRSLRPLLAGRTPPDWRRSMYYRYWEHDDGIHHVWAHYGVRTLVHKLVFYYADGLGVPGASAVAQPPQWELFDLERDPFELDSVHDDPGYAAVRRQLTRELARVQAEVGDRPWLAGSGIDL